MTFKTERLPLAIYLHASQALKLIGCKRTKPLKVEFVFDDPDSLGSTYELDFEMGKAVPAASIFASQKYLRRMMSLEMEKKDIRKANDNPRRAVAAR